MIDSRKRHRQTHDMDTDLSISRPHRSLDDEQLDSADDEDRYDRVGDRMDYEGAEEEYQETVNIMDLSLGRAPEPLTSKDEVGPGRTGGIESGYRSRLPRRILGLHHAGPQFPLRGNRRIQPGDLRRTSIRHRGDLALLAPRP